MFFYPFDVQRCSVLLQNSISKELVTFSSDQHVLTFLDDHNLPAYYVESLHIHVNVLDTNQTVYSLLEVTRGMGWSRGER